MEKGIDLRTAHLPIAMGYAQRKFKLVKRKRVYNKNLIPPSLLNCECSQRTPTVWCTRVVPGIKITHTSYFYGICIEREGFRYLTIRNILIYQFLKDVASYACNKCIYILNWFWNFVYVLPYHLQFIINPNPIYSTPPPLHKNKPNVIQGSGVFILNKEKSKNYNK